MSSRPERGDRLTRQRTTDYLAHMPIRERLNETTLRDVLKKHPDLSAAKIARRFDVSREWVRQVAKKAGLRLAGSGRSYVEGL